MENIKVIVGIAGFCAAIIIPHVLVYFSQKGAQKFDMGVYIKRALPLQHNLWIMQVLVFAIFAINTVTILYVEHLSNQLLTLYNWCIK